LLHRIDHRLHDVGGLEDVAQSDGSIRVAAVRYGGGGDWYQAQTPLPFLLRFIRENTLMDVALEPDVVELGQEQLFRYPFIFISGTATSS
jgi:hypothetical protein